MSDWANNHRRNQMVSKFKDWADGRDLPIEDGKPVPLSHCILRIQSEGGRALQPIPIAVGFNPALFVDTVLDEVEFHGEEQRKRGVEPLYALHVHCGNREAYHYEFSIGLRPRMQQDNLFPVNSLNDPAGMAAALVANAIQQSNHKDTLFYGAMGSVCNRLVDALDRAGVREDRLWARIEKQDARIDAMNEREAARRMSDLDIEIKRANAQMILGLKKIGAEALMPLLTAAGHIVVKKAGTAMGITEMDVDETQMQLAEHIAKDPARMAALIDGMDDDLKSKAILSFQVLNERVKRKRTESTVQASLEGVKKPLSLEKFTAIAKAATLQKAG